MNAFALFAFLLAFVAFAILFPLIALTWFALALIFGVGVGRRLRNSSPRGNRGHDARGDQGLWSGQSSSLLRTLPAASVAGPFPFQSVASTPRGGGRAGFRSGCRPALNNSCLTLERQGLCVVNQVRLHVDDNGVGEFSRVQKSFARGANV